MNDTVDREDLFAALHNALAQVHEWDELTEKLAVFGLDPEHVRDLLEERWLVYRAESGGNVADYVLFVRGFVEGLLTGMQLNRDD